MESRLRKPARWLLLLAVLALVAAACGDGDEDADPGDSGDEPGAETETETEPADDETDDGEDDSADNEPVEGGTVLFGDEQEPEILNGFLIDGNSLVTSKVTVNTLAGAYMIQPDFSLAPDLIDGEAEFTEDPFTVTYNIKEEAAWNDGTSLTSEDFEFTWQTIMNEDYAEQITSTSGYDLITEAEIHDEKSVTFHFSEPYAPWQLLFSEILPKHVLEGEDFLTVWNDGYEIASGPYQFDSWDKGQQLTLVRNENYWGGDVALDEIIMRYVPDTTTLTQQFRGQEINMYDPQPQVELVSQLESLDGVVVDIASGPVWEHIDFNTLVPGLDKTYVRQAIIQAIDRDTVSESLIGPINPDVETLQNPFYMNNQPEYTPVYDQWSFDPDAAVALLEENGCEREDGGNFVCDGDELSFRFTTTGGNERRELTQQLVQDNLADIGIEITIDNDEGATAFNRMDTPENCGGVCDFDMFLFAWVGSPDPVGNANIYGCDRPQNWHAWCDEEATRLMDEANATVDPEARAELWNEAAAIMAEDVPVIPMFQQPQLAAWQDHITGPAINPTNATVFWNSATWAVTR